MDTESRRTDDCPRELRCRCSRRICLPWASPSSARPPSVSGAATTDCTLASRTLDSHSRTSRLLTFSHRRLLTAAWEPNKPLSFEDVTVAPPKAGEVRVKVIANALCHTDIYTLDGDDPEGLFPCILGHEAGAIVESIGEGVTSVEIGDHIVPGYTPQCNEPDCIFCRSPKTNLCPKIRATQGAGVMPDGTSRFTSADGTMIHHFMGCSTMSEYTVLAEISCAKINKKAPLEKVCLFGCGVATGWGAVWNNANVESGSTVAVFGLGAVGLAVVQAAQIAGASRIIAVDMNEAKFAQAVTLGATDCVSPASIDVPIQEKLIEMTQWGADYTCATQPCCPVILSCQVTVLPLSTLLFLCSYDAILTEDIVSRCAAVDCTGNVEVMRAALESAHRGWGVSCVIGVAAAGKELATRPFQLVTGRRWIGTAFGGWKTRSDVPMLVDRYMSGELPVDHFITHTYMGVDKTNEAIDALHSGDCLRAVVNYSTGTGPQM